MNDETQSLIDNYKRQDGVVDWYKVLDIPRTAPPEQIEMAYQILSATFHPETYSGGKDGAVRYILVQKAFEELGNPARKKKYDAFCRFEFDHARLLTTIDAERQRQQISNTPIGAMSVLYRVNSRPKRIALLVFPFFAVIAIYRLIDDMNRYSWEPSLSFCIFFMASIGCILLSFTKIGDWLFGEKP